MNHFYQNIDGWSSEEEQGMLLRSLLYNLRNKEKIHIAEIGVYKGRCTAMWVVELKNAGKNFEYWAIDHFKGSKEHKQGVDYLSIALKELGPVIEDIKLICNDSVSQSKMHADGYFDIVYIDGSHEYEDALNDIKHWLPKVKKGGFICGDDYNTQWPGVIKAVNYIFNKGINKISKYQWWIQII